MNKFIFLSFEKENILDYLDYPDYLFIYYKPSKKIKKNKN